MRIVHGISPAYVPHWGRAECVREHIQNGADEQVTGGFALTVTYNSRTNTLTTHNKGAEMVRCALMMGGGKKAGNDLAIGENGEGSKLANLAGWRKGLKVYTDTRGERWRSTVEYDEGFGGETLVTRIRKISDANDGVTVVIQGITPEEWEGMVGHYRFLKEVSSSRGTTTYKYHPTGGSYRGTIIQDGNPGELFVKGIFVTTLKGNWAFAYDLKQVELNRDRDIPDMWDVEYQIRLLIAEESADLDCMALAKGDTKEAGLLAETHCYTNSFHREVVAAFVEQHGEGVIPCSTPQEVAQAQQHGLSVTLVSEQLKKLLQKVGPLNIDVILAARRFDVSEDHKMRDLSKRERRNLSWAVAMIMRARPEAVKEMEVTVVTFCGDLLGLHKGSSIKLAREILEDRAQLISVLIHEMAHNEGGDGTPQHRREIESISADIIVSLTGGE